MGVLAVWKHGGPGISARGRPPRVAGERADEGSDGGLIQPSTSPKRLLPPTLARSAGLMRLSVSSEMRWWAKRGR